MFTYNDLFEWAVGMTCSNDWMTCSNDLFEWPLREDPRSAAAADPHCGATASEGHVRLYIYSMMAKYTKYQNIKIYVKSQIKHKFTNVRFFKIVRNCEVSNTCISRYVHMYIYIYICIYLYTSIYSSLFSYVYL